MSIIINIDNNFSADYDYTYNPQSKTKYIYFNNIYTLYLFKYIYKDREVFNTIYDYNKTKIILNSSFLLYKDNANCIGFTTSKYINNVIYKEIRIKHNIYIIEFYINIVFDLIHTFMNMYSLYKYLLSLRFITKKYIHLLDMLGIKKFNCMRLYKNVLYIYTI